MDFNRLKSWLPILLIVPGAPLLYYFSQGFIGGPLAFGLTLAWIVIVAVLWAGIKIVPEYDRLVIFRLGRCIGARGPGMVFVIPFMERVVTVDTRERFHEVSHEACITKDNAKINVDFLFYWKVVNPVWSQIRVQKLEESLEGLATGLLRAVIGLFPLDDALAERERINEELKDKLEEVSEHWGVTVTTVEIREIIPPQDIQDAMHRQLAAERDRRAMTLEAQGKRESDILRSEGEAMALERLYRAAKEVDPKTLQLKYLEALKEVGRSSSTKYVLPLELTQFIRPFLQGPEPPASSGGTGAAAPQAPASPGSETVAPITRDELIALIRALSNSEQAAKPASPVEKKPAPAAPLQPPSIKKLPPAAG